MRLFAAFCKLDTVATTIRETVLHYIVEYPGKRLSVTEIAEACGLNRRQTISALHGLKSHGLEHMLVQSGSGHWMFTPSVTERVDSQPRQLMDWVPVGWEVRVRVTARFGDRYLVAIVEDGEDTGVRVWVEPVRGGIEYTPDK